MRATDREQGSESAGKEQVSPATTRASRWWLGLAVGGTVSAIVTIVVGTWEWLENPGGIFRSESGTNWGVMYDTAISWLMPTFVYAAVIASVVHLVWLGVSRKKRKTN